MVQQYTPLQSYGSGACCGKRKGDVYDGLEVSNEKAAEEEKGM